MFSNDQNIETIGQLIETLKHYAQTQGEYVKLTAVEKTVRLLTVIAMTAILSLLLVFILIFLSLPRHPAVGSRLQKAMDRAAPRPLLCRDFA